jgi:hypothetical protein
MLANVVDQIPNYSEGGGRTKSCVLSNTSYLVYTDLNLSSSQY